MLFRILADGVVVIHLAFVLFVVLGAWLVLKWPRVAFAHVPAFIWGALIEFQGWICPLTPLENTLRRRAGAQGYATGFIEHYLVPLIYPPGLTRTHQIILGAVVLALNLGVYTMILYRIRTRRA
jgi:hypothetical protein